MAKGPKLALVFTQYSLSRRGAHLANNTYALERFKSISEGYEKAHVLMDDLFMPPLPSNLLDSGQFWREGGFVDTMRRKTREYAAFRETISNAIMDGRYRCGERTFFDEMSLRNSSRKGSATCGYLPFDEGIQLLMVESDALRMGEYTRYSQHLRALQGRNFTNLIGSDAAYMLAPKYYADLALPSRELHQTGRRKPKMERMQELPLLSRYSEDRSFMANLFLGMSLAARAQFDKAERAVARMESQLRDLGDGCTMVFLGLQQAYMGRAIMNRFRGVLPLEIHIEAGAPAAYEYVFLEDILPKALFIPGKAFMPPVGEGSDTFSGAERVVLNIDRGLTPFESALQHYTSPDYHTISSMLDGLPAPSAGTQSEGEIDMRRIAILGLLSPESRVPPGPLYETTATIKSLLRLELNAHAMFIALNHENSEGGEPQVHPSVLYSAAVMAARGIYQ
jgi:hypothetical protein